MTGTHAEQEMFTLPEHRISPLSPGGRFSWSDVLLVLELSYPTGFSMFRAEGTLKSLNGRRWNGTNLIKSDIIIIIDTLQTNNTRVFVI